VAHLASLARYVTTGSLWAITLAVAVIGDRAPRRLYPGMLAIASAVTAGILADELAGRREDLTLTSCLSALKIDRRLNAEEGAGDTPHLRAVGGEGELPGRGAAAASGHLVKGFAATVREIG
jgi:hypothetical protein